MGACQTQQNIDINLIINNCDNENQSKKRKHSENRNNSINKKIKKAYINNIQFNNTKKNKNDTYKFKLIKPRNKIPLDKSRKEITIINKENNNIIPKKLTNKLNLSYTADKLPLDNIRSNSRDSKQIMNMSYNEGRIDNISNDLIKEKKNILTDRNSNLNTKDSEKMSITNNIKRKIVNDEDDTEKLILHLNEQIKNKKEKKNESLILSFDDFELNN